ncbi:SRPBCC domain-containing protein [uncultured Maritimibacter sp.]|jgi:uncharacterized protein YndB with AHSA1/START domain|uniref:SRPBCC domain-containing protein n=1 Tax=uncultured Maritimibacter sp. TaxID=991866 RepID=UPI0026336EAD|nr:SRPBCC domain-containing protein [uncultured Maritimibacter sp.]
MSIDHDEFTLTRTIAATPASVFRAFAEEDLKRQWFVTEGPGTGKSDYRVDFRVGGGERGTFEITEGPGAGLHANATTYFDIQENERIAYAYSMAWDGRVHSASLVTVEFAPTEGGTRLTYTERGAYFPPSDGAKMRAGGVGAQLDQLVAMMEDA